jgi:hypothetical protein
MSATRRLYNALAETFGAYLFELDHEDCGKLGEVATWHLAQRVAADLNVDNPRFDRKRFLEAIEADRQKRHERAKQRKAQR